MELFPITIAVGRAFCNRVAERKQLMQHINHGVHTVVVAPRRYGKSSLINQVLLDIKLPYSIMELTMAVTPKDVEQIIIKKVGELLQSILPKATKAKQYILKLFQFLNPEITLTAAGQKIAFRPNLNTTSIPDSISEILMKLDQVAIKVEKRIVMVMDEFQELAELEEHAIEASIRNAMQYSKNVVYIFSGSNRHMLQSMFNDKNRPFYNSCEILHLNRISVKDYEVFIQKEAIKKWGRVLSKDVINQIFSLSELHPNYVNRICGYFWMTDSYPTPDSINTYWRNFVLSRKTEFTKDILRLSRNQRRLLRYIAREPSSQPGSHDVCVKIGLSEASLRQALNKLIKIDYVHRDGKGYITLIDPAFRDYINNL